MGGEWGIGSSLTMEKHSAAGARLRILACCNPAIQAGLSAGVACLSQFLRSARPTLGRHGVHGARCSTDPASPCQRSSILYIRRPRSGISRLVERSCEDRHCSANVLRHHWQLALLRHPADDRVQLLQPRQRTGHVYPTFLQVQHHFDAHDDRQYRHRIQYRRDPWRPELWHAGPGDWGGGVHHHSSLSLLAIPAAPISGGVLGKRRQCSRRVRS